MPEPTAAIADQSVVLHNPPNAGLLTTIEFGAGGITDLSLVGFDVLTRADGTNVAFASAPTIFERMLFMTGDPAQGFFEAVGPVGIGPNDFLFDIAAAPLGGPVNVPLPPAVVAAIPGLWMVRSRWRARFKRV